MDLEPEPGRRLHVPPPTLWPPFKIRRDLNYALWFVFLAVSSVALVTLVSPLDPHTFLRFGFHSGIFTKQGAPAAHSDILGAPAPRSSIFTEKTPPAARDCDYSRGRWVWDETESTIVYNESCPFLDPGFRCRFSGRKDLDYSKWRWQPDGCDLPRFNASKLLEKLRNGRIVFAGDSIGRNQWESMICMLGSAVSNQSLIYEENGSPITKHKGFLSVRFQDYNLTVEYYRAPFLVMTGRAPANSPSQVRIAIKVHELHWYWKKWVGADLVVFNAGHWWNPEKTTKMGCYFQEGDKINMTMTVTEAFERSILAWKHWAMNNLDPNKTQVFFRSYSASHYRYGKWDEGGKCSMNTKPETDYTKLEPEPASNRYISNVIRDMDVGGSRTVQFLNITFMTESRTDAHPANNREPGTPRDAPEDCSHWCLPGVPDTWNELLYAYLLSSGLKFPSWATSGWTRTISKP